MKKGLMILASLWFFLLIMNLTVFAQGEKVELEPIVITATRTQIPIKNAPDSITIITEEEIKNQQADTVFEVLRNVPGTSVVQSGSLGSTTSVFLRGGESDHTLVLIDGMEVNSTTTGGFDFADLTSDNIERIEILRGAQSTLYGSKAIGGVINIITKKGEGKPRFKFSTKSGTHETFREGTDVLGSWEKGNYSFSFSRTDSDGQFTNDDYKNSSFIGKLGIDITESINWDLSLRYIDSEFGVQDNGFLDSPDVNRTNERKSYLINSLLSQTIFDWWEQSLRLGIFDDEFKDTDPPEPGSSGNTPHTKVDSRVWSLDWQHNFYTKKIFGLSNVVTIGTQLKKLEGENETVNDPWSGNFFFDKSFNEKAVYFQNQFNFKDMLFINAGARIDDVSTFGTETSPKVSGAFLIKKTGTKLKASYGEGFKSPTINELFFPNFGNPDLKPEKSKGYDAGIEQELFKGRMYAGATYFKNNFDNLITAADPDGDGIFTATNIKEAETEGVEMFLTLNPGFGLSLNATYTHQDTKDKTNNTELVRRPNDTVGLNINYNYKQRFNINLNVTDIGDRLDTSNQTNAGYTKIDLSGSLVIFKDRPRFRLKNLEVFAKAENLLGEDYEEAKNFPAPGVFVLGGIKVTFH